MLKHQDALLMCGTPKKRTAVTARVTVRKVTTTTTTTDKVTMGDPCVRASIAPTITPRAKVVTNLAKAISQEKAATNRGREAISPVPATIVKVAISREKVATSLVLATIAKADTSLVKDISQERAISREKATSLAPAIIAKAAIRRGKAVISPVRVDTIVVLALLVIILMLSTA